MDRDTAEESENNYAYVDPVDGQSYEWDFEKNDYVAKGKMNLEQGVAASTCDENESICSEGSENLQSQTFSEDCPNDAGYSDSQSFNPEDMPKYYDIGSYLTQRSHFVGTGLYATGAIEDLPPRYQKAVTEAFKTVLESGANAEHNISQEETFPLKQDSVRIHNELKSINLLLEEEEAGTSISNISENVQHGAKPQVDFKECFIVKFGSCRDLKCWAERFQKGTLSSLIPYRFRISCDSKFSDVFVMSFLSKTHAKSCRSVLLNVKAKLKYSNPSEFFWVSGVKSKLKEISSYEEVVADAVGYVKEKSKAKLKSHESKILKSAAKLSKLSSEESSTITFHIKLLKEVQKVFQVYTKQVEEDINKLDATDASLFKIQQIKRDFKRESNCFERCLSIYSKKNDILNLVQSNHISMIVGEISSGKSTQLAKFLLQLELVKNGKIICSLPKKIEAFRIAQHVSRELGTAVGTLVGYDIGVKRNISGSTKIVYTSDDILLDECIKNKNLEDISCIILDNVQERTVCTDLLLASMKKCTEIKNDLRVIISCTAYSYIINDYLKLSKSAELKIPSRAHPVELIWLKNTISINWKYIAECVKVAHEICVEKHEGDILIFLACLRDAEEACALFETKHPKVNIKLYCLNEKLDTKDQDRILRQSNVKTQKIIFATNIAETSLPIPGLKYVIDCGIVKQMRYNTNTGKNEPTLVFINKISAKLRKNMVAHSQQGTCYRMYSESNFKNSMPDNAEPEMLNTSLNTVILKILAMRIQPEHFDFVEAPQKNVIIDALDFLEHIGAAEDNVITPLGEKIASLPVEPHLSKLILQGICEGVGYEMIIITALLLNSSELFLRMDDNKWKTQQNQLMFNHDKGDFYTFLDIFKGWRKVSPKDHEDWCKDNCINSRTLIAASKTVSELLILIEDELSICVTQHFNHVRFDSVYEMLLLECFYENICIYSGYQGTGYISPYFSDPLVIHPSSTLCYTNKSNEQFIIFSDMVKSPQNFLVNVMPVSEATINYCFQQGICYHHAYELKLMVVRPLSIDPISKDVLEDCFLEGENSKLIALKQKIQQFTKSFYIDVQLNTETVIIYIPKQIHQIIETFTKKIIQESSVPLPLNLLPEKVFGMADGLLTLCVEDGGIVTDVVLPGEYNELTITNFKRCDKGLIMSSLKKYGTLRSIHQTHDRISVVFSEVMQAQEAERGEILRNICDIKPKIYCPSDPSEKKIKSLKIYTRWPRSVCNSGFIQFYGEKDCTLAKARLTKWPIYIRRKVIEFVLEDQGELDKCQLCFRNILPGVHEAEIKKELEKHLPSNIYIKKIILSTSKFGVVTSADIEAKKASVEKVFSRFTNKRSLHSLSVSVFLHPEADYWEAVACFKNQEEGNRALKYLQNSEKIDGYSLPLSLMPVINMRVPGTVYKYTKDFIKNLMQHYKTKGEFITYEKITETPYENLEISCNTAEKLAVLVQKLMKIIKGKTIRYSDVSQYSALLEPMGKSFINEFEKKNDMLIVVSKHRHTVYLYGPMEVCVSIRDEIKVFMDNFHITDKQVIDLKGQNIPPGFIGRLYAKYGLDFKDLHTKYCLNSISLDAAKGVLTLEGSSMIIESVEKHLKVMCEELYSEQMPKKTPLKNTETCSLCSVSVRSSKIKRLQKCEHTYCELCMALQVESKTSPLVCKKEGCDKMFSVQDIKDVFTYCASATAVKASFLKSALHRLVASSNGKIRYCPIPTCKMVYRTSSEAVVSPYHCSWCKNDLCTFCDTVYHEGMSCATYEECRIDRNSAAMAKIKLCPKCKTEIEKEESGNHVKCSSCRANFCWFCLTIYPSSNDVIKHFLYCDYNQ